MKIEFIQARDLPMRGSSVFIISSRRDMNIRSTAEVSKGQKRIEYDYIVVHISHPGQRPLIPISLRDVMFHPPPPWSMSSNILRS